EFYRIRKAAKPRNGVLVVHGAHQAEILLGLLEGKYGKLDEGTRERIQAADGETLQRWSLRLLTAASLEEGFDEGQRSPIEEATGTESGET
ncbi:MAG: hypothetical protein V5A19_12670, partial [Thiohalorhabdus sp.]